MLRGSLLVLLSASLWGTWSLYLRPAALPASICGPLVFLAVAVFCLPLYRFDRSHPRWSASAVRWLLLAGLFDGLNVLTFFGAIERTTVAVAVLSHYLAPVIIAVIAPRFGDAPVRGAALAAAMATGGLALILEPWSFAQVEPTAFVGAALGTVSAVFYALTVFAMRNLTRHVGPLRATGSHAFAAGLLLAPLAPFDALFGAAPQSVGLVLLGGFVAGVVAGTLFLRGITRIGPTRAAVLSFAEPLVAVLVGVTVFGEPLPPLVFLGGALILGAGLYIVRAPERAAVHAR